MNVSFFPRKNAEPETMSVGDIFYKYIRGTDLQWITKNIREEMSERDQQAAKKNLPTITPSGVFSDGHFASQLAEHSGLVVLDYDDLDSAENAINAVKYDPATVLAFISPRGKGIKVLVAIDPKPQTYAEHKVAWNQVKDKYNGILGVDADKSGSDVSRLCYLCYDADAYYAVAEKDQIRPLYVALTEDDRLVMEALTYVDSDDRDMWLRFGMALHHHFEGSEQGLKIWDHWSQSSDKYKAGECRDTWNRMELDMRNPVTVKTIYGEARELGWRGLPQDQMLVEEWFQPDSLTLSRILPHLEIYVRENVRTGMIEVSIEDAALVETLWPYKEHDEEWFPLDDGVSGVIREMIQEKVGCRKYNRAGEPFIEKIKYTKQIWFDCITTVASRNKVDPFRIWLEQLDPWDGEERLHALWQILGAEDNELHRETAKRVLIGAIRRTYEPGQVHDWMPILIGPQGSAKSALVEELVPHRSFHSSSPRINAPVQKQLEAIGPAVLVEYAEIAGLSLSDLESIKAYIARKTDTYRRPWAMFPTAIHRRWVAVGTANDDGAGVLPQDNTGNRRFVAINVKGIKWEVVHKYMIDNREQLWAEAMHLYQQDYPNALSAELQVMAQPVNEQYTPVDDIVEEALASAEAVGDIVGRTTYEIMVLTAIAEDREQATKNRSVSHFVIPRILKKMGYQRKKTPVDGVFASRWYPIDMTLDDARAYSDKIKKKAQQKLHVEDPDE